MEHWIQMAGALPYFAIYWTLGALSRIDRWDVIGMVGTGLLIVSFTLLQLGKVQTGLKYSTLNLCAALLLAVSLSQHFNLASMVIEVFWVAMSIYGIVKDWPKPKMTESRRMHLLNLEKWHRLMQISKWRTDAGLFYKRTYPYPEWDIMKNYWLGDAVKFKGHLWCWVGLPGAINDVPTIDSESWVCPVIMRDSWSVVHPTETEHEAKLDTLTLLRAATSLTRLVNIEEPPHWAADLMYQPGNSVMHHGFQWDRVDHPSHPYIIGQEPSLTNKCWSSHAAYLASLGGGARACGVAASE